MRYLMFLLGLMFANVANAMDCEKVPTCEELGYSTKDDPYCAENGYMFCPLDHSYKKCVNMDCNKMGFTEDDKTSWCTEIIKCKGNKKMTLCNCLKPRCNIGDVFYADGSCDDVQDYTKEKIAVGVVYDTNCAGGGKVISLKNLTVSNNNYVFDPAKPFDNSQKGIPWGLDGVDVEGLTNFTGLLMLQEFKAHNPELFDGQKNTEILLETKSSKAECQNNTYSKETKDYHLYCIATAAWATHQFYPVGVDPKNTIVGQGKWYFPAIGEMLQVYGYDLEQMTDAWKTGGTGENLTKINNTLKTLESQGVEAAEITGTYIVSSEYEANACRTIYMDINGERNSLSKSLADRFIRASLEF